MWSCCRGFTIVLFHLRVHSSTIWGECVALSSVHFKTVAVRLKMPICTRPWLSEVSLSIACETVAMHSQGLTFVESVQQYETHVQFSATTTECRKGNRKVEMLKGLMWFQKIREDYTPTPTITNTHARTHACTHTHTHKHAHTHTHNIHTQHTHTHTHTQKKSTRVKHTKIIKTLKIIKLHIIIIFQIHFQSLQQSTHSRVGRMAQACWDRSTPRLETWHAHETCRSCEDWDRRPSTLCPSHHCREGASLAAAAPASPPGTAWRRAKCSVECRLASSEYGQSREGHCGHPQSRNLWALLPSLETEIKIQIRLESSAPF